LKDLIFDITHGYTYEPKKIIRLRETNDIKRIVKEEDKFKTENKIKMIDY
jgi:hypothetical protein